MNPKTDAPFGGPYTNDSLDLVGTLSPDTTIEPHGTAEPLSCPFQTRQLSDNEGKVSPCRRRLNRTQERSPEGPLLQRTLLPERCVIFGIHHKANVFAVFGPLMPRMLLRKVETVATAGKNYNSSSHTTSSTFCGSLKTSALSRLFARELQCCTSSSRDPPLFQHET